MGKAMTDLSKMGTEELVDEVSIGITPEHITGSVFPCQQRLALKELSRRLAEAETKLREATEREAKFSCVRTYSSVVYRRAKFNLLSEEFVGMCNELAEKTGDEDGELRLVASFIPIPPVLSNVEGPPPKEVKP